VHGALAVTKLRIDMSAQSKVHGLDGTLVEPDWAPLTLEEVRAVVAQFPDAGEAVSIVSISPRPFSAASVVETSRERVFVKRHHRSVRDADGLMEEHRFMAHLRMNGAPVPRVFETMEGATAVESGGWTYEIHQVPGGIDLYKDAISWTPFRSEEQARSAGGMLARLHNAAKEYSAPARPPRPLVASFTIFAAQNPRSALEQYLAARPVLGRDKSVQKDCETALTLLAPFHADLLPFLPSMRPLWTHNDLHASNLFWSDEGPTAAATSVIDFGLTDRTTAVHDLAHAIERNIVEWLVLIRDPAHPEDVPVHLDDLYALLDGYEAVRPLSAGEAAALAPMTALCHAEFALTEADYFLGVLRSEEKARVATNDYLVGHARWFHTGGRGLLDALRAWAIERGRHALVRR
jgi:Ser/Thr protein kinase RdoA (MazF antagonist)